MPTLTSARSVANVCGYSSRRSLAAVFVDGAVALGLAIADAISWEELKDWLTLALVPLTPGVAEALAFWFPTKETD